MENVLQIHTEAVSAQFAHFYEVFILIIALLGPVEHQTSYKRLTYFTSQLPLFTSYTSLFHPNGIISNSSVTPKIAKYL